MWLFIQNSVRSDKRATRPVVYTGKNAVGTLLSSIMRAGNKIREILAAPKPIVMTIGKKKKRQSYRKIAGTVVILYSRKTSETQ